MTSSPTTTSTEARPAVAHSRPALAILALAVGGFTIGTTEFMTMGVLPEVADGVDVSVPTAGHIISAYALGVVVGVPILAFFGAALPRRAMLVAMMVAYAAFNLLSAAAPSYEILAAARFLDGLPHGAYFGVASLVAASLVAPERRGRAVASVMLGLSVANVVGVPLATFLGQQAGWRSTYLLGGLLALVTVALVLAVVPSVPGDSEASGRKEAKEFFGSLQVWLTMAVGAVGFGGMFAVYSYIAKTVTEVGGLDRGTVPFFVLALGLGMVVGTWLAGELAAWSVYRSLLGSGITGIVLMLVYYVAAPGGWLLWPVAFLVTAVGSVLVINLQLRLMDVAGDAVTLGAAMNHAALNIANALGAWLGGLVIAAGHGYRAPALVGAGLAAVGVVILLVSAVVHRRDLVVAEPA
ncbi:MULTISPECIES: MFS transporter [unclassified Nocardioides]|uniref:MFS transporter n=1 Tax=unclassified Nocardioides TaxID=2615069 RepID=UPI0007036515|nr:MULTISPECIES: MFS transporter [unclassified Nocardioides]KRC46533.1 MFS transporter [Nocardioides sp. Root79]KRC69876.1 MFS transporter [Nocardioides sp. Root240]